MAAAPNVDWPVYGGDAGSRKYSALTQINRANVRNLKPAWIYRCDDMREQPASTIECNPLVIDGRVYLTTPGLKVLCLDGATGREIWRFDPWNGAGGRGEVARGIERLDQVTETDANPARYQVTVVGTGVKLYATKTTTSGKARVYVDGVLKATVDLHAAATTYQALVYSGSFSLGVHVVRIDAVGTSSGSSSYIDVDRIVVT